MTTKIIGKFKNGILFKRQEYEYDSEGLPVNRTVYCFNEDGEIVNKYSY